MPSKQKKGKRPDKRPARGRYWRSRRLRERKIRNIMRSARITRAQAEERWLKTPNAVRVLAAERKHGTIKGILS